MLRSAILPLVVSCAAFAADIDSQGFILHWLILGPFAREGGPNPGEAAIRRDYLTDGNITELTVQPFPGMVTNTNFNIAASTGLVDTPNPNLNPGGKPTWYEYAGIANTIDFQSGGIYGADLNDLMTYAVCYIENLTGAPIPNVQCGVASDDAIQVYVNQSEIWINNVARAVGGSGQVQDWSGAFTLPAGISRLMVKVFEGWGGTAFRLKFQDGNQRPLLSDRIGITVEPYGPCPTDIVFHADSFLREITFQWENRFSQVEIWEGGVRRAVTTDVLASSLTLSQVDLGEHRYEVRTFMGPGDPPCDPVDLLVVMEPAWPEDFQCIEQGGVIAFSWHNVEGYYDVLKIQENGVDLPQVVYDYESATLSGGLSPGVHTFELVCELAGFRSSGVTCEVEVTGPPPEFLRGDGNADGSVDIADAMYILGYLFASGPTPACMDTADVNDDGSLDISDPVAVLRHLFGGEAVPDPGASACGPDPTADSFLTCDYPDTACP